MNTSFNINYYYNLAIGAYKKWKGYICSTTYNMHMHKHLMMEFERQNHFSNTEIENSIKKYVDELFTLDENDLKADIEKNVEYEIEPKITQIYSSDIQTIKTKKSFMMSCITTVKYYIYDVMYTLIILKDLYNNKSFLFKNEHSYNNRIAVNELFGQNGELNLNNNSLFQKYSYNYSKWQDDAKRNINDLINAKEESFILSYVDFENFFYNIPFNPTSVENCFNENDKRIFFSINYLRDNFCNKAKEHLNANRIIDGTFLPIGLISSFILSEIYMCDFDGNVCKISNISYYGRYCDDILFIYKNYGNDFKSDLSKVFTFDDYLAVNCVVMDGYRQLTPNEKSRSEINKESNGSKSASIVLAPSLIGEYKKISLKEVDLKEFIAREDGGVPDDPVGSISNDIYNYLMYGGESKECKRIAFKLQSIIEDNDKLYLLCSKLESCYVFALKNQKLFDDIKKNITDRLKNIDYLNEIDGEKSILNFNSFKEDELKEIIKRKVLFYNQIAYDRALAVFGKNNDEFKTFCYPIWFSDKTIDMYCKSYSEAQKLLKFYPYTIELSELYFSNIIDFDCENVIQAKDKYEKLFNYYFALNGFSKERNNYVELCEDNQINYIKFNLSDAPKDKTILAGVANMDYKVSFIDENSKTATKDYFKNVGLIIKTINDLRKDKSQYISLNYLVFPELYLNPLNLRKFSKISKSLKISLIGGCKYLIDSNEAKNQIANLIYFQIDGHNQCLPIIRLKNEYAPSEIEKITNEGHNFKSGKNIYYIIDDGYTVNSSLYCYELTDIKVRSLIKGNINMLIASEYNKDTFYFSNIIGSIVRDISCFALQANVSCYGDSRITAPLKQEIMNIASIKGGITDNVIIGELNIVRLEHFKLIQEFKNYVCLLDGLYPEDKYSFCEYVGRLSNYYGFKNVSGDIRHQMQEKNSKYVNLIDLFIKKVSDCANVKKKLFDDEEISDLQLKNYCKNKSALFQKIKMIIER